MCIAGSFPARIPGGEYFFLLRPVALFREAGQNGDSDQHLTGCGLPRGAPVARGRDVLRRVLLTGFDAFSKETVNPSSQAVSRLAGENIGGLSVKARELPTVFSAAGDMIRGLIDDLQPAVVISCGQAGGAHDIRIERLAVNIRDARRPDNAGNKPVDEEIAAGGPAAYWASVPTKDMVRAAREAQIPARVSCTAGSYVCNDVFYAACHHVQVNHLSTRVGFIHVPYLPEQVVEKARTPSMSVQSISAGLRAAVGAAVRGL